MSIRLEMLQVARVAPKTLGDSTGLVQSFLHGQQNPDGGFRDRAGRSDLYYTVFGIEGLMALQAPLREPDIRSYLEQFGTGEDLDFVHLCCLARCWASLGMGAAPLPAARANAMLSRMEAFRTPDGGFHPVPGSKWTSIYACFLAVGVYQDLHVPLPNPGALIDLLDRMRTAEGGWPNERHVPFAATNSTAAAVTLLRHLGAPVERSVATWLLARRHAQGGFVAVPGAPIPDLLSTATALHALSGLECDVEGLRESCLDFVDSLWTNEGAFHGHWDDHHLDCEYTYYGLLALGHLSL